MKTISKLTAAICCLKLTHTQSKFTDYFTIPYSTQNWRRIINQGGQTQAASAYTCDLDTELDYEKLF